MPRSSAQDSRITSGPNKGDVELVKKRLLQAGYNLSQAVFRPGLFENTFQDELPSRISVLHADGDYYESTLLTLQALYDRVSDGGLIILDDFGSFDGARKAFYTFVQSKGLMPLVHKYDAERLYWIKGEEQIAAGAPYGGICYNPHPSQLPTVWERVTQGLDIAETEIQVRSKHKVS